MLNKKQQEAVACVQGPLLVLAGAGSGKTHTLTQRVVAMTRDHDIPSRQILCVTFTNKAAKEMRLRIAHALDMEINPERLSTHGKIPLIGTFHSVGVYFLRLFIEKLGYKSNFVIYDEDDRIKVVRQIMNEKKIDTKEVPPKKVLGLISAQKNSGNILLKEHHSNPFFAYAEDIYPAYDRQLKMSNALDFDDILLKTYDILKITEVIEFFWGRFSHFLVDEYQDTNDIQYQIVQMLASHKKNLCVVWDDWQGIYSWRGARVQNILNFQKDYPQAKVIKLEQNYRSTKNIIQAANQVIHENASALDKSLWTDNEQGDLLTVLPTNDERQEASTIANLIRDDVQSSKNETPYSSWAVLYRTNGQSRNLEEALLNGNIPYQVYGWVRFYDRKEIKDIIAYFRILANPEDRVSFERIINVPSRKIGEKTLEVIRKYVQEYLVTYPDIIANISDIYELNAGAQKRVYEFYLLYEALCKYSLTHSPVETMNFILQKIDYEKYLDQEYARDDAQGRKDNIQELANLASKYNGLEPKEALFLFLEDIALLSDISTEAKNKNFVSLMTVHSAKGLEFDHVIIAGLEEGIFPHSRTLTNMDELEEERRLMYVAMTRAKKKLFLTHARERYTFGSYAANPLSRFITEVPDSCIKFQEITKSFSGFSSQFSSVSFSSSSSQPSSSPSSSPFSSSFSSQKQDPSQFQLGNRVSHAKFGKGTIVRLSWEIAEIAFSWWAGIKKMNILLAPLRKI